MCAWAITTSPPEKRSKKGRRLKKDDDEPHETDLLAIRTGIFRRLRRKTAKPVLYNLGCGKDQLNGFVGLDLFAKGKDIKKTDLFRFPWVADGKKIPNESVDYLYASHFIEHVPDWDGFFSEAYRVLKTGGYFEVLAPYYTSVRAWQDPDHKQAISEARFCYLNQEWLKRVHRDHFGARVNFEIYRNLWFYLWHGDYLSRDESAREFAKAHYLNVVEDVACILVKIPLE